MRFVLAVLVGLSACSVSEKRFIADMSEAECIYATSCFSADILTFYAWDSVEGCQTDRGPVYAGLSRDCAVYDSKKATECLEALDDRACSSEGPEFNNPTVCEEVFTSCEGQDTDP
jgi:hypothetical protein